MPSGLESFQDLIRTLGEHLEWHPELRRHVFPAELIQLPELPRQLADSQLRTEHRLERLAARIDEQVDAPKHTEQRVEQLAARVDELAQAQARTEQRLEQFIERANTIERDLSNLRSDFRGCRLEWIDLQRPSAYFGPLLRRLPLVWPSEAVDQYDDRLPRWAAGELLRADLLVTGVPRHQPETGEVWLVVEKSARVDRGDVERAVRRGEALRVAGLRALPAVASERTTQGAKSAVQDRTVVLFKNGTVEGVEG